MLLLLLLILLLPDVLLLLLLLLARFLLLLLLLLCLRRLLPPQSPQSGVVVSAAGVGHACSHPSQNPNSKAFLLQPLASARPGVGVLTRSYAQPPSEQQQQHLHAPNRYFHD